MVAETIVPSGRFHLSILGQGWVGEALPLFQKLPQNQWALYCSNNFLLFKPGSLILLFSITIHRLMAPMTQMLLSFWESEISEYKKIIFCFFFQDFKIKNFKYYKNVESAINILPHSLYVHYTYKLQLSISNFYLFFLFSLIYPSANIYYESVNSTNWHFLFRFSLSELIGFPLDFFFRWNSYCGTAEMDPTMRM